MIAEPSGGGGLDGGSVAASIYRRFKHDFALQ
jgi:hypothetical protein